MQLREKKGTLHKYLSKLIVFFLGIIAGVFACDFEYFKISKEISLVDVFVGILAAGVTIYAANNIQNALITRGKISDLFAEEIKKTLNQFNNLEGWLEVSSIPFEDSKRLFKKINLQLIDCHSVFSKKYNFDGKEITEVRKEIIQLRNKILSISPTQGLIILSVSDTLSFEQDFRNIKKSLIQVLLS